MARIRRIGLIVEDQSDYDALKKLVSRIAENDRLSFKPKLGHGGGKIRNKCTVWATELVQAGCDLVLVVIDLDEKT